jgi:hypothetical protein
MTEPVSSLKGALAERYRIERELGQGGMATVYLAQDLKHDRRVARAKARSCRRARSGCARNRRRPAHRQDRRGRNGHDP